MRERNFAQAYLLLFRFSILYLNKVSTLPEARTSEGRTLLKPTKKRVKDVLVKLENIKPDLVEARNRWAAEHPDTALKPRVQYGDSDQGFAARDAALSWNSKAQATLLDASRHQDFAVDLATEELSRRRDTRRRGISTEDDLNWRDRPAMETEASRLSGADGSEMRSQMEQARRHLDRREDAVMYSEQYADIEDHHNQPVPVAYHYPSIPKSAPLGYGLVRPIRGQQEVVSPPDMAVVRPPRPPKEGAISTSPYESLSVPPVPPRRELASSPEDQAGHRHLSTTDYPSPRPPRLPPKTNNSTTPPEKETFTFRPAGYLEDGKPIRPIFLPDGLRKDFLLMAAENTRRGIETCGILCGTNINNALFITCLLVPEQHGTPDTCETTNEAATFDYFEKEDLLQIGWIHTHPTQTCFMSSRDLHTQAGYQIMMDESIAIVCSPSHEPSCVFFRLLYHPSMQYWLTCFSWGIFRLTKPPGLQHLLSCEKTDTFHQHSLPADTLYMDAKNPPGHVFVTSRMDYRIHDLRKKN